MPIDSHSILARGGADESARIQEHLATLQGDRRNAAYSGLAATFTLMGIAILILARYPEPWSYALAFVVIGLMQYRMVIACHEVVHKALLYPLWLNESVGAALCALLGINLIWYRRQHMAHHAARHISQDTDAYIYEPILASRPGLRRCAVWIFGTVPEVVEKLRQKGFTIGTTVHSDAKARRHSLAIVLVQAALLAMCASWLSWWHYFAFWLLPLLTIAVFMNRTRVLVEHGYPHAMRQGTALAEAKVTAVDLPTNRLERFFVAPYMINYHFSHHQQPSIPFHRLEDLSRLFDQRETASASPSYAKALRRILCE